MDGTSLGEATPEVPVTTQPISLVEADDYTRGIITKIASLVRPEVEKKFGRHFTIFNPVYYMKKGSINYCLRIEVDDNRLIDVTGACTTHTVSKIKAKEVTKEDEMGFW